MKCRFCGMESRNPHVCEWCKRQLTPGGQPPPPPGMQPMDLTQPIPPGMDMTQPVPQHQFRTALTGEVVPVAPAPMAAPPPGYAPPGYPQPQPGYQQGYPQGYQQPPPPGRPPSVVPPHMVGLPHQAMGPELVKSYAGSYLPSPSERWEKCLAISLPILLASVWIVHLSPASLPWVVLFDLFAVALAMGGTAAIGSFDDAYMDVSAVLLVSFFFGPASGLAAYLIVGAMKQEFNGAVIALLVSHMVIRLLVLLAFPVQSGMFGILPGLMMMNIVGLLAVCATFGGWILSSFFRPLNE